MQQFILIRGHQGAGKSTFAQRQIAKFQAKYPNATIIHLENDLLLTDKNGNYHWSSDNLQKAQRQNLKTFKQSLKYAQQNRQHAMLIINSNTNQKAAACLQLIHLADKFGFDVQVYRLHNFFDNSHNVKQDDIIQAYIKLNNNPLPNEIHVPAIQPMNKDSQLLINQITNFNQQPLPFDDKQNTFVTAEYLRFAQHNFIKKQSTLYPTLYVLKYARHIFYNNAFDNALLEMRGLIIDQFGNIIVRPFKKVFNYSERIAKNSPYPIDIDDTTKVNAVVKVNGFLGVCTYVDLDSLHKSYHEIFNKQVLYSTTGSLDSSFAQMTKQHCQQYEHMFKQFPNHTFLFEITDPNDIHIIAEAFGETLIGMVDVKTGKMASEQQLDNIAQQFGLSRPDTLKNITFGDLKQKLKSIKHEGFMVFDSQDNLLFKLKSPFYLISKFFGRIQGDLAKKLNKNTIDEEYYPLIDHINANKDIFNRLDEQQKIQFIQAFLSDFY